MLSARVNLRRMLRVFIVVIPMRFSLRDARFAGNVRFGFEVARVGCHRLVMVVSVTCVCPRSFAVVLRAQPLLVTFCFNYIIKCGKMSNFIFGAGFLGFSVGAV